MNSFLFEFFDSVSMRDFEGAVVGALTRYIMTVVMPTTSATASTPLRRYSFASIVAFLLEYLTVALY